MSQKDASTAAYSHTYSPRGLGIAREPTDAEINAAYNLFDAEKMKYYHNVFVKLDRDFSRRKTTKPSEWSDFADVIKLCRSGGFDLRSYIKYCYLNRLVPKSRGKSLSDISYLKNTPQIINYARNKDRIERLYAVYRSIQKSILLVRKLCSESGDGPKQSIKKLLTSERLSEYMTTGTLSPYFVALIPNASILIHNMIGRREDGTVLVDFCNRIAKYSKDAAAALSMFFPSAMAKTVVELCS